MFQAYLFDLDGTLVDSAPDICRVANIALHHVGRAPLPLEVIRGFVGDGLPALIQRALNYSDQRPLDAEVTDPVEHHQATQLAHQTYTDTPAVETSVYPHVRETLKQLQRHARLGLVTNKPFEVTQRLLTALDLASLFSVVLGGDSLPQRKPDPAPVRQALAALSIDAAQGLFIGDHENDHRAARGAKVAVALVSYGYTSGESLALLSPDFLLNDIRELLKLNPAG
jgi:phosphoglycolate phosphatase